MNYRIYVDLVNSTARIHLESCRYYKNRKQVARPDNFWTRPLTDIEDAFNVALEQVKFAATGQCCLSHLDSTRARSS